MTRPQWVTWRHPAPWLLLTFAVAVVAGIDYALKLKGYYIMPDELTYQREAITIAHTWRPLFPGDAYYNSPSELAPLLNAPIWGLASTVSAAIDASHILNAILFASSCLPIYLLSRRITDSMVASLLAAAATVAVPWFALSGTMMTEAVAYPAFCWGVLAVHHAVAAPGLKGDIIGLAGVGLAYQGRSQLAVLGGALLAAVAVREAIAARSEPVRGVLRRHALLIGLVVAVLLYALVTGTRVTSLIGNYGVATEGDIIPPGSLAYARELMTSVGLACGVITLPIAAAWAFGALLRPQRQHAFAGALVLIFATIIMAVATGAFSVRFTAGQNDRYIAYVAPLLFTGTAAAFTVGPLRLIPLAVASVGAAWLYWTSTLALLGPSLVAPASSFRTVLDGRMRQLASHLSISDPDPTAIIAVLMLVALVAVALALWRLGPTVTGVVVGLAVLGYDVAETAYTFRKVAPAQAAVSQVFLASRGWADRAVPDGTPLNAFMSVTGDPGATVAVWWDAIFYNRDVKRVYEMVNEPGYHQTSPATVDVDARTGAIEGLPSGYMMVSATPVHVGLRGASPVTSYGAVSLVRVPAEPRASFRFEATEGSGQVQIGDTVPLRLFPDGRAGTRLVSFTAVARTGPVGMTVLDANGKPLHDARGRRWIARPLAKDVPVTVKARVEVSADAPATIGIAIQDARTGQIEGSYLQALDIKVEG